MTARALVFDFPVDDEFVESLAVKRSKLNFLVRVINGICGQYGFLTLIAGKFFQPAGYPHWGSPHIGAGTVQTYFLESAPKQCGRFLDVRVFNHVAGACPQNACLNCVAVEISLWPVLAARRPLAI